MLKGRYLRVLTPVTTNGVNPVMNPNGTLKYRESHMHINAQKRMEKKNAQLPAHLKHVIEVVEGDQVPPQHPIQPPAPQQKVTSTGIPIHQPIMQDFNGPETNGQQHLETPQGPGNMLPEEKVAPKRARKPAPRKPAAKKQAETK